MAYSCYLAIYGAKAVCGRELPVFDLVSVECMMSSQWDHHSIVAGYMISRKHIFSKGPGLRLYCSCGGNKAGMKYEMYSKTPTGDLKLKCIVRVYCLSLYSELCRMIFEIVVTVIRFMWINYIIQCVPYFKIFNVILVKVKCLQSSIEQFIFVL